MIRVLATALLAIAITSCNNSSKGEEKKDNTDTTKPAATMAILTDAQKADGWQLLFDGVSTKGWHKYGGASVGSAWKVADGTLYLDTTVKDGWQIKDGGDIVTDEEFENFHLKLEWKVSKDGNSGIMFYVHEDSTKYKYPWMTGPEMQILDNAGHADSKINKHRAGDLYDLISCSKETVKPAGEWNLAEIKCVNGKLDFYLNGENVVSTTLWDEAWKKSLAATKWKDHKDFGTYKKGRIALQDHGNTVWFKNVMIKKM
jgi:hypothetical protein